MSTYNYDAYINKEKTNSFEKKDYKVGYFSLKNDGDEAIVKFPYSSPEEFDMATVHKIQVKDKYRTISCLRNGHEPIDKCPLCANGEKLLTKFYVKLVEYTKDETGKVIAKAKVWERPAGFTATIKSLIDEYGDLKDQIFKIKRTGTGLDTRYNVFFANPAIYKKELGYTNDALKDFDDLQLNHHSYMERSKEDIEVFLKTGDFPKFNSNNTENKSIKKEDDMMQGARDMHPEFSGEKTVAELGLNKSTVQTASDTKVTLTAEPKQEQPQIANPTEVKSEASASSVSDPTLARPRRLYNYR
jgi:cytochrome c556